MTKRIKSYIYTQGKFGKRLRETLDTENKYSKRKSTNSDLKTISTMMSVSAEAASLTLRFTSKNTPV